jgi:hypothetical protein
MAIIEADANCPHYLAWKRAHNAYKVQAAANRPIYKAMQADAIDLGVTAAEFNSLCRAEIDEDVAADDSGEWLRAARVVLDSLVQGQAETDEVQWDEGAEWRAHVWNRACDHQLRLEDERAAGIF